MKREHKFEEPQGAVSKMMALDRNGKLVIEKSLTTLQVTQLAMIMEQELEQAGGSMHDSILVANIIREICKRMRV